MSTSRRKLLFILKSFVVFTIFSFFWIQIKYDSSSHSYNATPLTDSHATVTQESISPFSALSQLKQFIKLNNHIQKIHNEDKFGKISSSIYKGDLEIVNASRDSSYNSSAIGNTLIVMVVQVHNRANYLKGLIDSLRRARGIEDTLLIFSHDVYDEAINNLLLSVDFCRYMQIYYPYSIQLHPLTFPGSDARDCPRNMKKEDAQSLKCLNANDADTYGHYREAKYTQTKHHWVWKGNFVMNKLHALKQLNDRSHRPKQILYLFLEEDHFVTPDILHVLKLLNEMRNEKCQQCEVINLGVYTKKPDFVKYGNKFIVNKWFGSNMGLVLENKSWNRLAEYADKFCTYDDYNWDWSMKMVSDKFLDKSLRSLGVAAPRVFHVGECGVHFKGKSCKQLTMTRRTIEITDASSAYLFPLTLVQHLGGKKNSKTPQPFGGWSDTRDHQLCLHLFNSSLSNPIVTG